MIFSTILRRTANSVVPITIRAIGNQRNKYCSAVITSLRNITHSQDLKPISSLPTLNFSSLAQKSLPKIDLVRAIESEIEYAADEKEVDKIPDGFPFKIKDEPGKQIISLERQYQDEVINVHVDVPQLVDGEEGEVEEANDDDNDESDGQPCIRLVVKVSKGSNELCLEFGCTAYEGKVTIESLIIKGPNTSEDNLGYEGPDFLDLDEDLQNAFHKYLEDRGIKPSTTDFLYGYMVNKENREYLRWLENVKNFIKS